jgi:hypothetical protein
MARDRRPRQDAPLEMAMLAEVLAEVLALRELVPAGR